MGVGSNVVDRAIILERKRKQNELVARLIQRPERYDLHKQGILLTPPRNQREEEKLLQNSLRVDLKKGKNTSFVVKSSGTKSRSQIAREEREKELYEQRQKHVQRKLENHLFTRPPKEDLIHRNIAPTFVDPSGREFYVFNGKDFNSPGKPMGIKGRRKTAQKFEEVGAVLNIHLTKKMDS